MYRKHRLTCVTKESVKTSFISRIKCSTPTLSTSAAPIEEEICLKFFTRAPSSLISSIAQ